ncbi:precorrin-2 dehydrogenase/sirohydrochlorin ferrochelatase family protein [Archaeoglobus neptunius]|uniref:precorrin-2 dehydrogenase/sirohydrochlorin ferrochelatase family protein n=1 Tax=Archaeoglobus neptunius TaxID=2798580 RepID=UPI001925DEF5|nr:bifunctional precorrin-2 dehydrogenase/sirohydrochlorin ferrochelatase [Archaeoglobus neptunius]
MRIPLYIEFQGKRVAVIGGGGVGTLRAKKFIEAGAEVSVFSQDFSSELLKLSEEGKVELVRASVESMDFEKLASNFHLIVVAIGSKDFNERVIEAAEKHKAMVNLANDAKMTEVVVPFEGGKNGVRFAVTTEGKSGVVARKVRDKFQRVLDEEEELFYFLNAMDHLKSYMKKRNVPVNLRMKLYSIVSSDVRFVELVKQEKVDEARKLAEEIVEEYVSGKKKAENGGIEF